MIVQKREEDRVVEQDNYIIMFMYFLYCIITLLIIISYPYGIISLPYLYYGMVRIKYSKEPGFCQRIGSGHDLSFYLETVP